ncbi:MAG TPA: GspMb/PilO family protein [Blastocatellia bacterium]|nr:GspMb/PilO family protein [Blastocatellia bacterium]
MSSQVRERVSRLEVRPIKMPARPFGLSPAELLAAAAALLFFVLVVTYYFTTVRPEQDRLRDLKAQRDAQQTVIDASLQTGGQTVDPSKDAPKQALDSLNAFKGSYLTAKTRSKGEAELFKEINALAKKNSLQLMSGIEVRHNVEQSGSKSKRGEKSLDVFPKLEINFSVFGQLENLRKFINQLEQNNHFLIIQTLSLTSIDAEEGRRGARVQSSSGISLAVSMSAYFQSE